MGKTILYLATPEFIFQKMNVWMKCAKRILQPKKPSLFEKEANLNALQEENFFFRENYFE